MFDRVLAQWRQPLLCFGAAALLLPAVSVPLWAHDMTLLPSSYVATPGDLLSVALAVGDAGQAEPVPRMPSRIVRFEALGPAGQVSGVPGLPGSDPAGYLRPDAVGLWTVVYESTEAFSELAAATFTGYLQEEGLDQVVRWRQQRGESERPGRELYRRSLKSLIRVGTEPTADRVVGLPLELVLEGLPLPARREITLRAWWRGKPLAEALIDLHSLSGEDKMLSGRTDSAGRLRLPISEGRWMAAVVHMERSAPDLRHKADWQSVFSTLTFAVSEP